MPTPLYDTDVQKIVDRTPKTALLDTDVFVVADEDGTLSPITKPNAKATIEMDTAEGRLDTLEGADTVEGSVAKTVKELLTCQGHQLDERIWLTMKTIVERRKLGVLFPCQEGERTPCWCINFYIG